MLVGALASRGVVQRSLISVRAARSSQQRDNANRVNNHEKNSRIFLWSAKRCYGAHPVKAAKDLIRRMGKPATPAESLRELRLNDPRKSIENDLTPEKNILVKDLPSYTPEEIQRVEDEARRFKAQGQFPPADVSRQLMYIHLARDQASAAYINFYDLKQKEAPSLFDFNLIFAFNGQARDFSKVHETYDYMKECNVKPSLLTMKVLFKCFGESGSIGRIMEVYERMFLDGYIPDRANLECVLKAAALAGDPHYFYLFYQRLQHKRFPINNDILKSLMDQWKSGVLNGDPRMSSVKLTANDFSHSIALALRVHNYRLAFDLIRECRDTHNIQPDAFMYETFLEGCIRAGYLREQAREWKKRFHRYPKGVEKREDHFEFLDFLRDLQEHLLKLGNGDKEFLRYARPKPEPPGMHDTHTTRRQSRQLYKNYPRVRYVSQFDEEFDFLEWTPDYKKRREMAPILKEEEYSAAALAEIQRQALEDLRSKQAQQQQQQTASSDSAASL